MKQSKILQKILTDKKYLMDDEQGYVYDLIEDYVEYIQNTTILKPKAKIKTNYIGIEIECFTKYDRLELMEKIIDNDLSKMVATTDDGSIEPDFGRNLELRVLLQEKQLSSSLKKLDKLFVKNQFGVNDSCGLHIHLDMRNRNMKKCYNRLIKFQKVLFAMVDQDRWDNNYCSYTTPLNENTRHVAINKIAYREHKTIEIRLHHSTLDIKLIEKWVNLLLRIVDGGKPPVIKSKTDVLEWAKKQPKNIYNYVRNHLDDEWFEHDERVASNGNWGL